MSDSAPPDATLQSASGSIPLDTDDTRGKHFRRLIVHPTTLILAGIALVGAFIALAIAVSPGAGGGGAALVLLITVIIVWLVANARAKKDFFTAYAQARGLTWSGGQTNAPPVTSLMRKGDSQYMEQAFNGTLPGGLNGTLGWYTYEDESTDSEGNTETTYYKFTVAMSELPETAKYIQELAIQRRSGFRFMDSVEDKFRKRQRVEVESEVADKHFEIFIGQNDDMSTARQILSPTFIVWLAERAPDGFFFELEAGSLVCAQKGQKKAAGELDEICHGSSAVARRLVEEARE
jgi:hypothetical protein